MAQSALTVTPPSPTPPTNMGFHGATPPNVPNFTKTTYANPFNMDASGRPQSPYGVNPAPAPYLDVDASTAGPLQTFATNQAASASGTSTTSGGTEGSYPGTGTAPFNPNMTGAVPAASSVAHEGSGSEVTVLAPGNITHTYVVGTLDMSRSASCGLTLTAGTLNAPNATHASATAVAATPTITGAPAPNNTASGIGTVAITLTGTNYVRQSVVYVDGIAQNTNYVSATSLTVTNAPKKLASGTRSVTVQNGVGGPTSAASTWTFT